MRFAQLERSDNARDEKDERNSGFDRLAPFIKRHMLHALFFRINTDMVESARFFQRFDRHIAIDPQLGSAKIQFNALCFRQVADILFEFRRTACAR